jgi:hypothetical protein
MLSAMVAISVLAMPFRSQAETIDRTLVIASGADANSDGRDDQVTLQTSSGDIPAYVLTSIPSAYAVALEGSRWIGPSANSGTSAAANVTSRFKVRFNLPASFTAANLSIDVHADNFAKVWLNGTLIGQQTQAEVMANFQLPAETISSANNFRAGSNELWIDLYNYSGPAALDFQLRVNFSFALTGLITPDADATVVPDQYIVVLKDTVANVAAETNRLVAASGATLIDSFADAGKGFAAIVPAGNMQVLLQDPAVDWVEHDQVGSVNGTVYTQQDPTWGLDRIDQTNKPYDQQYRYVQTGRGVNVYVIDTGIQASHPEFEGRAVAGYSVFGDDSLNCTSGDYSSHATMVAGIIGSKTYGVAKQAKLISVKGLNCHGGLTNYRVVRAVNWVTRNVVRPAVVNMSLGGPYSPILNKAVRKSIAAQITYVVAAGNEDKFACNKSPASVSEAITVGATGGDDARASFSNWGICVDLFAPGLHITSTAPTNTIDVLSGTSFAAPFVAGAAALYLQTNPSGTPERVQQFILSRATVGLVKDPKATPNRLLYAFYDPPPPPPAVYITGPTWSAGGPPVHLTAVASPTASYYYTWYEDRCTISSGAQHCWTITTGPTLNGTSLDVLAFAEWRYSTVRVEIRSTTTGAVIAQGSFFVDGPAT